MKKIFILALLLLTLCCHASAASSIQIDNVTSKEVNNYIVNFITASGQIISLIQPLNTDLSSRRPMSVKIF